MALTWCFPRTAQVDMFPMAHHVECVAILEPVKEPDLRFCDGPRRRRSQSRRRVWSTSSGICNGSSGRLLKWVLLAMSLPTCPDSLGD
ncbi:hypothetical protein FEF34_13335 [Streptomyces marianii]|uniref:Uncharacterized protein n=1 Tax=Streptomyces marianii TaxID=1817406 RepID=A0A5R9E553_9ACTN|nr:hypothetical protein FEF34_13335 [Streptomyces marianii]